MTVALTDPFGFGVDIVALDDISPVWGLVAGELTVAYDLYRRVTTTPGSFDEFEDEPIDTIDIRSYLNGKISPAIKEHLRSRLAAVCKGNPRVKTCTPEVTFTFARKELTIALNCETDTGPFDLVLKANLVTVEILSINGRPAPAATAAATTTQIITVAGTPGEAGPAGPAGSSGTPSDVLDFGDQQQSVLSGTEEVVFQRQIRFGDLGASLTVAFVCQLRVASGTATVRVRIGGSKSTADGTIVNTGSTTNAAFQTITDSDAFSNPTGTLWVKVTVENTVVDQAADIEFAKITIR